MTTVTDTITVHLVHSTSGLMAEIEGLPVQAGPEYVRHARNRELAAEALQARYPELVIRASSSQGETGFVFWCEAL